ncbi:MAG: RNA polymerase sigma factor, partial [Solirubrobacteraceae bacterium]
WEKRDTLRSPEAFRAWAMTIARNVMLGRIRRRREAAVEQLDPASDAPAPEDHVDARRSLEQLEVALQALPEAQREAVLLVRLQGLKFSEAAAVLGVPENTVKTRVRRALLELAAALDS